MTKPRKKKPGSDDLPYRIKDAVFCADTEAAPRSARSRANEILLRNRESLVDVPNCRSAAGSVRMEWPIAPGLSLYCDGSSVDVRCDKAPDWLIQGIIEAVSGQIVQVEATRIRDENDAAYLDDAPSRPTLQVRLCAFCESPIQRGRHFTGLYCSEDCRRRARR